jgi:hypothetical protein
LPLWPRPHAVTWTPGRQTTTQVSAKISGTDAAGG